MDTENCTSLYLQTCQTFLTANYQDPNSFEGLYKLLPWLRQSLTCCICSKVLNNPMSSTQSYCQHFICKCCKGGKMVLKPSCGWCKDQDEFVVNPQLVILINCFKKICELIHNSPILEHIKEFDKHCQDQSKIIDKDVTTLVASPFKKKRRGNRRSVPNKILSITVGQVLEDALDISQQTMDS